MAGMLYNGPLGLSGRGIRGYESGPEAVRRVVGRVLPDRLVDESRDGTVRWTILVEVPSPITGPSSRLDSTIYTSIASTEHRLGVAFGSPLVVRFPAWSVFVAPKRATNP